MKTALPLASLLLLLLPAVPGRAQGPMRCRIAYHPADPTSRVVISWIATPTNRYDILATSDLGQPWGVLNPDPVVATNTAMAYEDLVEIPQRFYQVVNRDLSSNMVWIPPGVFTMGSPAGEAERDTDEGPLTTVTLSQGFWIGKYEVTQTEYLAVTGVNPSRFTNELNRPVEQVNWSNAVAYCTALTDLEQAAGRLPVGYEYRLPTDAQWEYACRAGTTTAFHYGPALRSGMANFNGTREYDSSLGTIINDRGIYLGETTPVGSYAPNPWRLHDMHGNVWEWVRDWYASLPGGSVTDPAGPATGVVRVLRGGGWGYTGGDCRAASRSGSLPTFGNSGIGFRAVLAPTQP